MRTDGQLQPFDGTRPKTLKRLLPEYQWTFARHHLDRLLTIANIFAKAAKELSGHKRAAFAAIVGYVSPSVPSVTH
jgi:hypothetical protein